ncbi:50S ribosomal protein L21e [Candidatus Woesearchaeota archaeon]|nr:50S ribosomal protein L21e [Candidatus Woesearchaeota archaeon]
MAKRIGTKVRKTRHKMRKSFRRKGKISLSSYFQKFNVGDKVCLSVESAYQGGMYNPRYMGKIGVVKSKRGKCFEISVNDKGKEKTLIAHPVHLKRV